MHKKASTELSLKDLLAEKFEKAKAAAENFGSVLEEVQKVADAFGVDMSYLDPAEFLQKGIAGYQQIEDAETQLRNNMQATGQYSEESFNKIVQGADEMAQHVNFGKAEIEDMQSRLATVGEVGTSKMNDLSQTVTDVATKMNMNLADATDMMVNALNNPAMLQGFGNTLGISPEVIQSIQNYSNAGDKATAQVMLLHAVQSKVAGSANEAFNSDPLARYNKAIENAQESVGEMGMEILNQLKPAFTWLGEKLNDIVDGVKDVVKWFKEHKTAAENMKAIIIGMAGAILIYSTYLGASAVAAGVATAAQLLWNSATGANPLGAVILGLTAFIAILYEAYKKVEWVHGAVWAVIGVFKAFGGIIKEIFMGIGDILNGSPTEGIKKIEDALTGIVGKIARGAKQGYAEGIADFNTIKKDEPVMAKPGPQGKPGRQGAFGMDAIPAPSNATGTKSTTINISINKQIETLNIKTTNLAETASKIQEHVAMALTNAVNQSQVAAGGR